MWDKLFYFMMNERHTSIIFKKRFSFKIFYVQILMELYIFLVLTKFKEFPIHKNRYLI